MLLCAFRSFAVLFITTLAAESQVHAFTVHRGSVSTKSPDLFPAETILNQKDDDVNVLDINKTEIHNKDALVRKTNSTKENTTKSELIKKNETSDNTSTPSVKVKDNRQVLQLSTNGSKNSTATNSGNESFYVAYVTNANKTVSNTSKENPNTTWVNTTQYQTTTKKSEITGQKITTESTKNINGKTKKVSNTSPYDYGHTNETKHVANGTDMSDSSANKTKIKTEKSSFYDKNATQQSNSGNKTQVNNSSYSTKAVLTETTNKSTDTSSNNNIDGNSNQEYMMVQSRPTYNDTIHEASEISSIFETTTISETTIDSTSSSPPYWKKYTEIDRKRGPLENRIDENNTDVLEYLVRAETAQSPSTRFPSKEKALSSTSDSPLLEKLKDESVSLSNKVSPDSESNAATIKETTETEDITQTGDVTTASLRTTSDPVRAVVTSMRAGFLDHSSRVTSEPDTRKYVESPRETDPNPVTLNDSEIQYIKDNVPTSTEIIVDNVETTILPVNEEIQELTPTSLANINADTGSKGKESQSLMASDAIDKETTTEEPTTEEIPVVALEENSKKFLEEGFGIKETNNTAEEQAEKTVVSDLVGDETLSVKPIPNDRKNYSIYTVNPNYKPLKKIDVQPPKPFVRDPDDNSWRNESLSTLGIVFKAKNASKAFTEVLKNKTEMQLNAISEPKSEEQSPELRTRLEKIAERRKSKKKKTDNFGNTFYSDYEENTSNERTTTPHSAFDEIISRFSSVAPLTNQFTPIDENVVPLPKKHNVSVKGREYESDEDVGEYVHSMHDIDLKKFNSKGSAPISKITPSVSKTETDPRLNVEVEPVRQYLPERKPTVQYFPPREKPKVVVNEYDDSFKSKINEYIINKPVVGTHNVEPVIPLSPEAVTPKTAGQHDSRQYTTWNRNPQQRPNAQIKTEADKTRYVTNPPAVGPTGFTIPIVDEHFNRPSYVIKHLGDFIEHAAKADDAFITEVPAQGVTAHNEVKPVKPPADYYDYEAQFRKDVLDRFVENFNQHSDRFKVDFPVLYNTSIVHNSLSDANQVASSSAFMKRLYDGVAAASMRDDKKRFDPNCDRTIELSPAYELHYYVPEEEEKLEQEQRPSNSLNVAPYFFRL